MHSLIIGLSVFCLLGLVALVFPENGILLNEQVKLSFLKPSSLLTEKKSTQTVEKIIQSLDDIDTNFQVEDLPVETLKKIAMEVSSDTIAESEEIESTVSDNANKNEEIKTSTQLITKIQSKNKIPLKKFFDALANLKQNPKTIRVMHYGDSQIEGDRITDYLRLKFQGQFGGQGPGLITLMPVTPSVINKINLSNGWLYYHLFTMKDKRVNHGNFGVMAGFNRFAPYKKMTDTSSFVSASFSITTTKLGGSNALSYKKLKLFYGGSKRKTWCEFYDGPALIAADSLLAGGTLNVREYSVGNGSNTHCFKFKGKDSPDFYGVSLESNQGVMVDNIAMRGSSGTFFHHMNLELMKEFYSYLNTKLIILQFGGNALPSILDSTMAKNYAGYIRNQLILLKKMAPNASILFIGPSDMSMKVETEYITYPLLEKLRDELKKVVLESGCAFYDLYDTMGGKNSMPVWVDERMAAKDYIHFSPQGARKISTLLYAEIIKEYNAYLKSMN